MANRWLVEKLIRNAKLRGFIVESDDPDDGFATDDFLTLIDDITRSILVPLLKRTREDYLLREVDLTLTSGRAVYPLPPRASAEALHSIRVDPGDGSEAWPPLIRTDADKAYAFRGTANSSFAYYLKDDSVVFVPTPSAETVRFVIYNRPNMVVEAGDVGQVYAINTATKEVTLRFWDTDDEDFTGTSVLTTFTTGAEYDFIKGEPGFRCHAIDQAISGIVSNVLTFTGELPEDLAIGDFVCLAGESPIPQIPAELHPLLAQEVNRALLEGQGSNKTERAERTAARLEKNATDMISPRVTEAPRVIQNFNAPGWNKGRLGWRWR